MNFGIIGYGAIGDVHAQVIAGLEDAKLVAVASRTPEKAEKVREKYGCDFYTDYRDLLRRSDIDIVSICTPAILHLQMALDAAAAGKHCIVEKPIEINTMRAEEMIEAFQKKGLKLCVIFQHRFDPASIALKRLLYETRFGKLNYGTAKTIWFRDEAYYRASIWRGAWNGDGGGALMNQAVHSIDLLQYFMGPVQAVCGKCDTLYHLEIETEDIGLALLRFENGALGVIEGTTLAYPGRNTEVSIYGQKGSAGIRNHTLEHYCLKDGKDAALEALLAQSGKKTSNRASFIRQYQDMIAAVKENRPPLVTGEEGMKSVQIINAIYESSAKNAWIDLRNKDD